MAFLFKRPITKAKATRLTIQSSFFQPLNGVITIDTKSEVEHVSLMQWQMYQACSLLHAMLEEPNGSVTKHKAAETLLRMAAAVADNPNQDVFDRAVRILLVETAMLEADMQALKH